MEICERQRWTLEQWFNLSEAERLDWLAWRHRRRETLMRLLQNIMYDEIVKDEHGLPVIGNDGKDVVKHYVKDYGAYIDVWRELNGC